MSLEFRSRAWWAAVIGTALGLLAVGAGVTYFVMRPGDGRRTDGAADMAGMDQPPGPPAAGTVSADAPLPDLTITLPTDLVQRAGLVIATATTGATSAALRLPGIVQPNLYNQVAVTPLVAGRVTRVPAQLGATVRRGQTLTELFSPELAEAQTRFAAARADLTAHDRELQRTEKLAAIGAASQQELDRVHAEHAAKTAGLASARSRLQLLGMSPAAIQALAAGRAVGATITVPAPIAGVVTERIANIGLNVDPAMKLFTVVNLSTVWVIANLPESDFGRVRVGSFAAVTAPAYPGLVLRGRVSYIDPQVRPETRTAEARVEISNPGNQLRIGMFVDVAIETPGQTPVVLIPQSAVQNVGGRQVVYLVAPGERGKFIEREVRLGERVGDLVEVLAGVKAGDAIVAQGSFYIRAERERLGLRPAERTPAPTMPMTYAATVRITDKGFEPARMTVPAGRKVRLTFIRTTDNTCATEVAFPSLNIKRAVPLNAPVTIEFTPEKRGEIAFACGMDMLRGTLVVQ